MNHYVLVLNCGSSSLKFSVVNPDNGDEPFKGIAERLNTNETGSLTIKTANSKQQTDLTPSTHEQALLEIVQALKNQGLAESISAVGHRVVHGGEYFSQSVVIDDSVRDKIADCIRLAPLHNPAHVTGIDAARKAFPNLTQVAVFDTAFHQQMPEKAYLYALPYELYQRHGIRRYGFHGTSFRYISAQLPQCLGIEKPKAVVCHLGNGGSLAAIDGDHSLDTTMGLTPLEGLVHGTRSGDIDPAIPTLLCQQNGMTPDSVSDLLWKQSGLLGLSGISNDCRTLEEALEQGNEAAQRAMHVYCYRLAKLIAAQVVALGGLDALVFTGGIGENSSYVRSQAVKALGFLGLHIDASKNDATIRGKQENIASAESLPIWVIPTNEEWLIAHDAHQLAQGKTL
ncbi:acetate/propionate family kinase [Rappaport israeli]|uniref:acetate/propionate family kinase n=1 Tax=Rappaport israeli TaxID=1839807 RepID=UPI00092FE430|nr:acetate kinase [Rappaport israeli]